MWWDFLQINEDSSWTAYMDSISNIVSDIKSQATNTRKEDESKAWIGMLFFLGPMAIIFAIIGIRQLRIIRWTFGSFPSVSKSPANLLEAKLSLTMNLIACDKYNQMRKLTYFHSYIRKTFPIDREKLQKKIERNFDYPIGAESICRWLYVNYSSTENKAFLEFLLNVSYLDQGLKESEYNFLRFVANKFNLDDSFLDSLIQQRVKTQQESEREEVEQPRISKRSFFLQVLNLHESSTAEQVKAQYRTFAKKFHPDRFSKASAEQQEQAHQRFIEIQEAYEYLCK